MEYSIKRNELLTNATNWMNLKNIVVSDRSQYQKFTYTMAPFLHFQNDRNYSDRKYHYSSVISQCLIAL